jgi:hypothetical protein
MLTRATYPYKLFTHAPSFPASKQAATLTQIRVEEKQK